MANSREESNTTVLNDQPKTKYERLPSEPINSITDLHLEDPEFKNNFNLPPWFGSVHNFHHTDEYITIYDFSQSTHNHAEVYYNIDNDPNNQVIDHDFMKKEADKFETLEANAIMKQKAKRQALMASSSKPSDPHGGHLPLVVVGTGAAAVIAPLAFKYPLTSSFLLISGVAHYYGKDQEIACESLRALTVVPTVAAAFRPLDMAMNYAHMTQGGFPQVMRNAVKALIESPQPASTFKSGMVDLAKIYKSGIYQTLRGAALKNILILQTDRCERAVIDNSKLESPDESIRTAEQLRTKTKVAFGMGFVEAILSQRITLTKVTTDAASILHKQAPKPATFMQEFKFSSVGFVANASKKSLTILPYTIVPLFTKYLEEKQNMSHTQANVVSSVVTGAVATPVINIFDVIQKYQMTTMTAKFESKSILTAAAELGFKGLIRGGGVSALYGLAGLYIISEAKKIADEVVESRPVQPYIGSYVNKCKAEKEARAGAAKQAENKVTTNKTETEAAIKKAQEEATIKKAQEEAAAKRAQENAKSKQTQTVITAAPQAKESNILGELQQLATKIEEGRKEKNSHYFPGLYYFFCRDKLKKYNQDKEAFAKLSNTVSKDKNGTPEFKTQIEQLMQRVYVPEIQQSIYASPTASDSSSWSSHDETPETKAERQAVKELDSEMENFDPETGMGFGTAVSLSSNGMFGVAHREPSSPRPTTPKVELDYELESLDIISGDVIYSCSSGNNTPSPSPAKKDDDSSEKYSINYIGLLG